MIESGKGATADLRGALDLNLAYSKGGFQGSEALLVKSAQKPAPHTPRPLQNLFRRILADRRRLISSRSDRILLKWGPLGRRRQTTADNDEQYSIFDSACNSAAIRLQS
jgi:hypothetical protein